MNEVSLAKSAIPRVVGPNCAGPLPRILYIVTRADHGGAQVHLLNLALLMRDRFEVHLAVGEEGFLTDACRAAGITVHIVQHLRRTQRIIGDLKGAWLIYKLLRTVKPDLIHVHTFKAGFVGRLAGRMAGIPAVYTIHAWLWGTQAVSKIASWCAVPLERLAAYWCERVITVSKAGEKLVLQNRITAPEKVVTVYNGIADLSLPRTSDQNPRPVITMVARFTAGKDYSCLIKAFALLYREAELWLIGDGETRPAMEQLATDLKLGDRVRFLGEREDVPQLLSKSDVFVLSSDSEQFPISILEAMRAGVAVLASDVGGVREAVVAGMTGLLFSRSDVMALRDALRRVLDDDAFRMRLGQEGRARFKRHFEAFEMANETYRHYVQILLKRGIGTAELAMSSSIAHAPEQTS